jgi:magnesium chelatase family protein
LRRRTCQKNGGRFDLPIALALLAATCQILARALIPYEFYGELSLGGELRAVRGLLSAICQATLEQHTVMAPRGNLLEAERIADAKVVAAPNLAEVVGHL